VRPGAAGSGLDRLAGLRHDFGQTGSWPPAGLHVVEGDIRAPNLGLGAASAAALVERVDQVLHCAALVDFAADRRDEVLATNYEALHNLVPLVRNGETVLNLVSTAYVCGESDTTVKEGAPASERPRFRNSYEESKYLAEHFVAEELGSGGAGFRVLRPSIVIGEHATGRTSSFNTLYVFLEILESLHARAESSGTDLDLRIRCDEQSGLNLVPVDWLAETMLTIVSAPETEGGYFHLTNPAPVRLRQLGDLLSEVYPLLELRGVEAVEFTDPPPDSRERTVDRGLALYRSYLENHPRFDVTNTLAALGSDGPRCPTLDREWLSRMIDHARQVRWGREHWKNGWGREPSSPKTGPVQSAPEPADGDSDAAFTYCRDFFDSHLAGRTGEILLPRAPRLDALFEVRLTDRPDFFRRVELRQGRVERVSAADTGDAPYRLRTPRPTRGLLFQEGRDPWRHGGRPPLCQPDRRLLPRVAVRDVGRDGRRG
jgi:nucleoside-diphosphate-sugar epimerase